MYLRLQSISYIVYFYIQNITMNEGKWNKNVVSAARLTKLTPLSQVKIIKK